MASIAQQLGHGGLPNERVDMFCRSVYALGFVASARPIAGNDSNDGCMESERLSNSIQQYFGDLYEDAEQVRMIVPIVE